MLTPVQKSLIADQNALHYGYPLERLMENAGKGIAQVLTKHYGTGKRIGFFCGPGNNGGDGFVAARYLTAKNFPEVYLVPAEKEIKTKESRKNWQKLQCPHFAANTTNMIPDRFDIIVDCLFGTGIKGALKEPYQGLVQRLNRLQGKKVTVDLATPGFQTDLEISLMYPKSPRAILVEIDYPQNLKEKIGAGEIKALKLPEPTSHKGENGKLLILGGSEKYHGAPLLAAKIAGKIVDLVYFASVPQNNLLVQKIRSRLCEFIAVDFKDVLAKADEVDAILIGPGLDDNAQGLQLMRELLHKYPRKKFILDADALTSGLFNSGLKPAVVGKNILLTPHQGEFKKLFGLAPTRANLQKMARKYGCIIVLKGAQDYVASPQEIKINLTGNAGMTKGGTGDVLAGLIAALACKNDLFLAACSGVFLNGLAGDQLQKRAGYFFNASDLINEIPKTFRKITA